MEVPKLMGAFHDYAKAPKITHFSSRSFPVSKNQNLFPKPPLLLTETVFCWLPCATRNSVLLAPVCYQKQCSVGSCALPETVFCWLLCATRNSVLLAPVCYQKQCSVGSCVLPETVFWWLLCHTDLTGHLPCNLPTLVYPNKSTVKFHQQVSPQSRYPRKRIHGVKTLKTYLIFSNLIRTFLQFQRAKKSDAD
jgi:hypothetical protein